MRFLKAFVVGALAVPIFHQGMLALLVQAGIASRPPFSLEPTQPFGIPSVVSLTFWGGVWGIILLLVVARTTRPATFWLTALLFGTLATTLVAGFVVAPLKGMPLAGGGEPKLVLTGLAVNFAWALGTTLFLRWFGAVKLSS